MKLNNEQIKALQDKFLGKRIRIPCNNTTGFGINVPGSTVTGVCFFIGYNPHCPSWELQVTLNRTPYTNVDHTKIELVDET